MINILDLFLCSKDKINDQMESLADNLEGF